MGVVTRGQGRGGNLSPPPPACSSPSIAVSDGTVASTAGVLEASAPSGHDWRVAGAREEAS